MEEILIEPANLAMQNVPHVKDLQIATVLVVASEFIIIIDVILPALTYLILKLAALIPVTKANTLTVSIVSAKHATQVVQHVLTQGLHLHALDVRRIFFFNLESAEPHVIQVHTRIQILENALVVICLAKPARDRALPIVCPVQRDIFGIRLRGYVRLNAWLLASET